MRIQGILIYNRAPFPATILDIRPLRKGDHVALCAHLETDGVGATAADFTAFTWYYSVRSFEMIVNETGDTISGHWVAVCSQCFTQIRNASFSQFKRLLTHYGVWQSTATPELTPALPERGL